MSETGSAQKPEWKKPRKGTRDARIEKRAGAAAPYPVLLLGWLSTYYLISNFGAPKLIRRPCSMREARRYSSAFKHVQTAVLPAIQQKADMEEMSESAH